ncbi:MAG: hypothetical protein RIA09_02745 [Hoeflea sp.]|uniref:hypothetical protein n=1 Tax=Hoeflea sp. TaxID=1940281 RepID=UPI0032EED93E
MISRIPARSRLQCVVAASLFAAVVSVPPAMAQTSASDQQAAPVDRIIDSEVHEEQVQTADDSDRVIAAIEKASENTSLVRKVTDLDRVDIVFMPDSAAVEGGPPAEIATKLDENSESIDGLRRELESNALLYHAINSRNILITDVVGIEFDGEKHMVIFAAAKPSP